MNYERHGECDPTAGCEIRCCRRLGFPVPKAPNLLMQAKVVDFYKAREVDIDDVATDMFMLVEFDHVCPQLDATYARCGIYATRPAVCREFPGHPSQNEKLPGCTYTFVEVEA